MLPVGVPGTSWDDAVALGLAGGQIVSAFAGRPAAHTRALAGALATEDISLALVSLPEMALGKAVHVEPSQCCVEAA